MAERKRRGWWDQRHTITKVFSSRVDLEIHKIALYADVPPASAATRRLCARENSTAEANRLNAPRFQHAFEARGGASFANTTTTTQQQRDTKSSSTNTTGHHKNINNADTVRAIFAHDRHLISSHLVNLGVELLVHDVPRHRAPHHELPKDLPAKVSVHQSRAGEARLKRFLGEGVVERLLVVVEPAGK